MEPKQNRTMRPKIKVMFAGTGKFFGPGAADLLREIDICGNVRKACAKCGFSYSKGWTIIRRCEEELGYPVVERQPGGQSGGSARVTDKGRDLLAAYEELESELNTAAEERFDDIMQKYGLIAK